ncbi:MAG: hypothetical protein R3F43_10915 [bacterium]
MASKSNDSKDLHVLLVGLGHYPGLLGAEAPGCLGDLMTWFELLANQGLDDARLWIGASIPAAPADPVLFDRTAYDIHHAHGLTGGDRHQRDGQGTLESLRALIDAFVESLPARSRALVVWSGHGWTAPDGSLHLATASSWWGVDATVCGTHHALTDTLPWNELADRLAWPAAVGGPGHRPGYASLPAAGPTAASRWARSTAAAPSASASATSCSWLPGCPAGAAGDDARCSVGVFTWASPRCCRAGGRRGAAGASPRRSSSPGPRPALLKGITQMPAFEGDLDAPHRLPGLGLTAPDPPGIEIDPGTTGRVYDVTGGVTTLMVATTATKKFGAVDPKRLYWSPRPSATASPPARPRPPPIPPPRAASSSRTIPGRPDRRRPAWRMVAEISVGGTLDRLDVRRRWGESSLCPLGDGALTSMAAPSPGRSPQHPQRRALPTAACPPK